METTWIVGDPSAGTDGLRFDSMGRAVQMALSMGLDPSAVVFPLSKWVEFRQQMHAAANARAGTGIVSDTAVARQDKVDAAVANLVGSEYSRDALLFERGRVVHPSGVTRFDAIHRDLKAHGLAWDNMRASAEAIEKEERRAIEVDVKDLRLDYNGDRLLKIKRLSSGKSGVPITEGLLNNLLGYFGVFDEVRNAIVTPASLGGLDPDHKVEIFNRFVVDRLKVDSDARSMEDSGKLSLWLRFGPDGPQVFHVSSRKHTSHGLDGAQYLRCAADALESGGIDLYGQATYDPKTTDVNWTASAMPNYIVDLSTGDVFKGGQSGYTNDTNGGKFRGNVKIDRNACENLIVVITEIGTLYEASHNMRPENVRVRIIDGMKNFEEKFSVIAAEWKLLRRPMPGLDGDEASVRKVLDTLRDTVGLSARTKLEREAITDAMVNQFNKEPGTTYADALNALSALHFEADLDAWQVARLSGVGMRELVKLAAEV